MKSLFNRPSLLSIAMLTAIAASPGLAHAEDLLEVYQQARQSDPVLAQAEAQKLATSEGVNQARAQLLPQITGSYSYNQSHTHSSSSQPYATGSGDFQVFSVTSSSDDYGTTLRGQVDQTLVDFSKYANLKTSHSQADAQNEQYRATEQSLIVRVAQAYFDVLTANDNLSFAKAEEKALSKQLDQAQQRYEVGLSAITDVNEAKANHDAAVANVINTKNALDDAREALTQITGKSFGTLETLREDLPMNPPSPNNQKAWVDKALAQNPQVLAQRYQVDAAEHSISAARAGHLPTLGASVVYSRNPGWSDLNSARYGGSIHTNSNRETTSVGLVLNIPIFSGGATQSRVRQSIYERDAANDLLEQNRRQVTRDTRNAFRSVVAGISEVEARRQAVISAKSALDATQAGFEVGSRNIIDVLNGQQQLFQARSAYSLARHNFIINKLLLKQSSGDISYNDLKAVNALLVAPD
ncbi:MAG: TolC family outer membrane protein [Rhodanobacteraceae bacterium]